MTKYEYKKFQIKIGKTRRYRSMNMAAFKINACMRIFHSSTTISIDEETIWFKKKTYIFVMIRAIFFGSNDLVSGSVVAVQEKKYTMN